MAKQRILLHISDELADRFRREAAESSRTLSGMIEHVLHERYEHPDRLSDAQRESKSSAR